MRSIRFLTLVGVAATLLLGAGLPTAMPARAGSALATSCPLPPSGPQFYAPRYPGYARTVALTFDDGPGRTTARILRILRSYRIRATFFNVGEAMVARPALVREEAQSGFLLGNHTWSHPNLTRLTRRQQATQVHKATAQQRSITGTTPCVFRPPYGSYNATTLSVASYRRMAVWLWSVDTEDWKANGSASAYWVNRIVRQAENEGIRLRHPVILMHNQPAGNPATALALPTIIRFFRLHHYRFVTLLR
jgi:peptidoglycan/xylan/chitin deacetylase (PgdA/CDA1 family)